MHGRRGSRLDPVITSAKPSDITRADTAPTIPPPWLPVSRTNFDRRSEPISGCRTTAYARDERNRAIRCGLVSGHARAWPSSSPSSAGSRPAHAGGDIVNELTNPRCVNPTERQAETWPRHRYKARNQRANRITPAGVKRAAGSRQAARPVRHCQSRRHKLVRD